MDKVDKIPIYLYKDCVSDLVEAVEYSEQINCNVLVTSITNPQFKREFHHQPLCRSHIRFTRSELLLEPSKWMSQVVAKLSDNIDCDSPNETVRKSSEATIKQEISFAQHVAHQMLCKINGTNTSNLARTICAELTGRIYVAKSKRKIIVRQSYIFSNSTDITLFYSRHIARRNANY